MKDKVEKIGTAEEGGEKKNRTNSITFFFYLALPAAPFCIELLWQLDTLTRFWYLHTGCDGTLYEEKKKKSLWRILHQFVVRARGFTSADH